MKTVFKVTKELDIDLEGCGHVAERHRCGESRGIQSWNEGCVNKRSRTSSKVLEFVNKVENSLFLENQRVLLRLFIIII